jgi:hypothetical protein
VCVVHNRALDIVRHRPSHTAAATTAPLLLVILLTLNPEGKSNLETQRFLCGRNYIFTYLDDIRSCTGRYSNPVPERREAALLNSCARAHTVSLQATGQCVTGISASVRFRAVDVCWPEEWGGEIGGGSRERDIISLLRQKGIENIRL